MGKPEWLQAIQQRSGASEEELFRTYNGGVGFVLVVEQKFAQQRSSVLERTGLRYLGDVIDAPVVRVKGLEL